MSRMNGDPEDGSIILSVGEWIFNIMVLNVLWTVCSLPVVTIGASTTALNYTCIKLRRDEGDGVIRMFFRSFARNIRQALIIWTVMLCILIILSSGLIQALGNINAGHSLAVPAAVFLVIAILLMLLLFTYTFMVLARFENTMFRTVTNAVYFIVSNILQAFRVWGIELFTLVILPYAFWVYIPYLFPLVIFFGAAFTAWNVSGVFNDLFSKYIEVNDE